MKELLDNLAPETRSVRLHPSKVNDVIWNVRNAKHGIPQFPPSLRMFCTRIFTTWSLPDNAVEAFAPACPSYQNSPSTEAISASNLMAWRPCQRAQVPEVRALQRQLVFCLHASKTMINGWLRWLWHVLAQIVDERNASKCCASWYMDQPILYRVSFIQGRAGFRPSTVREYTVGRAGKRV